MVLMRSRKQPVELLGPLLCSMMKALKVWDEDICINPTLVRKEDELAVYFTYGLAACPRHFSIKETYFICHEFAQSYRQPPSTAEYTIDGGHRPHTMLYYITKQHMCANQTVHDEMVRMCSWTTLSAQEMHSTFARHVPSSREVLIENALKCPCLNRMSRGTPQTRLSSHCIWKPPVVRCSMHQRMVIG